MKSPSRQRRVRSLRAKAAVMDSSTEFEDYGSEPNMKLSHAFMVVLALHVVAVGGLFAFNKVKASHSKTSEKVKSELVASQRPLISEEKAPSVATVPASEKNIAKTQVAPSQQQAKIAPAAEVPSSPKVKNADLPSAKVATVAATAVAAPVVTATAENIVEPATVIAPSEPVAAPTMTSTVPAAGKEYTIVKGDNPYKIAKRFHVSYDSLIKFNNITDPRKIQIGQKLKIPAATVSKTATAAKKTSKSRA